MSRNLALLAVAAACSSSPVHTPLRTPAAPALSVESCSTLGEVKDGRTCSIYDVQKKAFSEAPDGTPEDAMARRAFLYARWLDLYNSAGRQPAIRRTRDAIAPGTPESVWGAESEFEDWDDVGDSAGFTDTALLSALYQYAVTGTEADYQRFESWVRGMVMQWDATGLDGYLARFAFAGVPTGTQLHAGLAMDYRDPGDTGPFDVPAAALPRLPSYFTGGIDGKPVLPSWHGHTSIDAYSGSMNSFPLAFALVRDKDLKARMARHYGCFLKRLRIAKITNLSKNAELQSEIAHYLTSAVLKPDPGDPDLTKVDEIWAFYLPQYNHVSAATYDGACPDTLAQDAAPGDVIDVSRNGFDGKLFTFIQRQIDGQDAVDSIDFAYFPSIRGGDGLMLDAFALGAYSMTGDAQYLKWRDEILDGKANGKQMSRTVGAVELPRPCRSYYRTPNMYTAHLMRTLLDNDGDSHAFALTLWKDKFAAKEMPGLRDALFEIQYSAALGQKSPGLAGAVSDLLELGGAPGYLDDPRRNYSVDLRNATPAGITVGKASADEISICSTPVKLLGIDIPTDQPDPNALYVSPAPKVMDRPPDNWIWEKDPFAVSRTPGDAGHQQYCGLDLLEPYWEARYYGFLPETHLVLAWK